MPTPRALEFVDVDSDVNGYVDILATNGLGSVVAVENSGGAGFTTSSAIETLFSVSQGGNIEGIAPHDYDGDGDLDIGVVTDGGLVFWYERTSSSTFYGAYTEHMLSSSSGIGVGEADVEAVDFDEDGLVDIVATAGNSQSGSTVLYRRGVGQFLAEETITSTFRGSLAVGDIHGDGQANLVAGGSVYFYEDGGLEVEVNSCVSVNSVLALGDLDGDGRLDLVEGHGCCSSLTWYLNVDEDNLVSCGDFVTYSGLAGIPHDIEVWDMDLDGDMDLVVADGVNISWLDNTDGAGTFALGRVLGSSSYWAMDVADVDGAVDVDIAVGVPGNGLGVDYHSSIGYALTDLGFSHAGTGGLSPALAGTINLATTPDTVNLTVSNGLPFADAYLFIGFSQVNISFKGGTMVPSTDILLGPNPLDAQGARTTNPFALDPSWTGTDFFTQFWIEDAGASHGFSASNALMGTAP